MSQPTLYVAFPASDELRDRIDAFLEITREEPDSNHVQELEAIMDPFLDEVLHTYFTGPILRPSLPRRLASAVWSAACSCFSSSSDASPSARSAAQ